MVVSPRRPSILLVVFGVGHPAEVAPLGLQLDVETAAQRLGLARRAALIRICDRTRAKNERAVVL